MNRAILVASATALLPASAFAYIGSGFKSEAVYRQHLREEYLAKTRACYANRGKYERKRQSHLKAGRG